MYRKGELLVKSVMYLLAFIIIIVLMILSVWVFTNDIKCSYGFLIFYFLCLAILIFFYGIIQSLIYKWHRYEFKQSKKSMIGTFILYLLCFTF